MAKARWVTIPLAVDVFGIKRYLYISHFLFQTQILYRWVEPQVCVENVTGAVTLPPSGEKEDCPPCNPGFYTHNTSTCLPCPHGTYSDGTTGIHTSVHRRTRVCFVFYCSGSGPLTFTLRRMSKMPRGNRTFSGIRVQVVEHPAKEYEIFLF